MRNLGHFHRFLKSLSPLLPLDFELWDTEGCAFSSNGESADSNAGKKRQALATHLMGQPAVQGHAEGTPSLFGAPIRWGEDIVASLIAYDSNGDPVSAQGGKEHSGRHSGVETFIQNLAQVGEDYWNYEKEIEALTEEVSQNYEELAFYGRLSNFLQTLDLSETLVHGLLEDLQATLDVDLVFLHLPGNAIDSASVVGPTIEQHVGDVDHFITELNGAISESTAFYDSDRFILDNSKTSQLFEGLASEPYRLLLTKLEKGQSFSGWLGIVSFTMEEYFQQNQFRFVQAVARQMAIQFTNTDLYNDLKKFVIGVVRSLVSAIEAKDSYTRGHSERVHRYAMMMGQLMDLSPEETYALRWSSILHDVGKIGISDAVLCKPGRLTDEEFDLIRQHPSKGYEILAPIKQIAPALPGVLHHHERYDGGGYPAGLKGDAIPKEARIIAVADTFDAITSVRSYRAAKSPQEAMQIIEEVSGSQLDPTVVDVFKQVYEKHIVE